MDLIIIRHGLPVRQVADGDEGPADPGLSETGRAQAERTAAYLGAEGVDHVVASTMARAYETAVPLAGRLGIDIETIDDLKESDHASRIYVPAEEISPDDPATAHYFEGNLHDHVFSDGLEAFEERVMRGFTRIIDANRSKRVAVFCHGMVTAVYLRTILRFDDPLSLTVDYCGISRVRASATGMRSVRSVNETHHVRDLLDW